MGVASAAPVHNFGKYSLVAKLATGGMAEIYLARLQGVGGFEKLVCIKRILPHLAKDHQLVEMFLAEARIAAQISHPNVCQVFELGEIDGRYFIAMEYLEGVPLSCFRRRDMYAARLDPRLVAGLGVQACEGLHHAHQLKRPDGSPLEVVHRDVSSNNLFATTAGVVKVLDFGIAKVQDASVRTSTGSVKGTYAYMAPEQLRGERVDRRTDVFAVGIVLWELFARRHLFRRETDYLTFQAITAEPIPDVLELRPDVPPQLAQVIARALARDREARFPTARALGEALSQSVQSIGGAWTAGAIADEIASAFAARMAEQQALIRVAREGGVLDLDADLGPAVGHGTALVTTPVSIISSRGAAPVATDYEARPSGAMAVPDLGALAGADPAGDEDAVDAAGSVAPASAAAPRAAGSPRVARQTPPAVVTVTDRVTLRPSRWPIVALALIALAGVGAAVFFYLSRSTPQAPPAPPPERVSMQVAVVDAAPAPPVDAAVDAASQAAGPRTPLDAAIATASTPPDTRPPPRPDPTKPPPPVAGPPGFITIDSTPVYAVIFIDGKRYGETPLVRISLPPGKHAVRAVSPSGASRAMTITIDPGKVAPTRRIEW